MESLLQVVLYLSPLWVLLGMYIIRKDAIIENVKSKVMESVMPDLGGGLGEMIPDFTGPAAQQFHLVPCLKVLVLGIPSF